MVDSIQGSLQYVKRNSSEDTLKILIHPTLHAIFNNVQTLILDDPTENENVWRMNLNVTDAYTNSEITFLIQGVYHPSFGGCHFIMSLA